MSSEHSSFCRPTANSLLVCLAGENLFENSVPVVSRGLLEASVKKSRELEEVEFKKRLNYRLFEKADETLHR